MNANLNTAELETKVQSMYQQVAENPHGEFHFEMGRGLACRLGYAAADLDGIPPESIDSFAGVGHFFPLADLRSGETVVDLGSGSGMDAFLAARRVGGGGRVIGIDMTDAQLAKAERLRDRAQLRQVTFRKGYIEKVPLEDGVADCVISNGVINLAPQKNAVFAEAARLLKTGGRLAIADIVTEKPLPESVVCNATLWAACIGGASQQDAYRAAIEAAGLEVVSVHENPAYGFLSSSAKNAVGKWGVKSISLLAPETVMASAAMALAGGVGIGLGGAILLLFNGRLATVVGIVTGLGQRTAGVWPWQAAFVAGLVGGGLLSGWIAPSAFPPSPAPASALLLGGVAVGFGARLGGGCTSGHGVCGVSRLARRSIFATLTFMLTGAAVVALARIWAGTPSIP